MKSTSTGSIDARATSKDDLQGDGPTAWRNYQAGEIDRLQVWAPRIRRREAQLPLAGSAAASVLGQLVSLSPAVFEGAVVSLFQQVDVVHQVSQTRLTADGGFDFEGPFQLPPPLEYSIDFRGEVKRYGPSAAVGQRTFRDS